MTLTLTPRERFAAALDRKPLTGRVPHFELIVSPTMELFGKVHPLHRNYRQWDQMQKTEQEAHLRDMAELYLALAERFEHSAIFLQQVTPFSEELPWMARYIREKTGNKYFIIMHGDATFEIPSGDKMVEFAYWLADNPAGAHAEARGRVEMLARRAEQFLPTGGAPDGFALCSDYCFNTGPFLSPSQFSEFVTPYLAQIIKIYRDMGFYTIKHTDGNIMPILDQMVQANPHALHSLDPQGGVDIAEVKRRVGDRVALCGNVNCGLMDTGTDEEVAASVRYALRHGMPGGGYIFCTSNCVYTGMKVARYELMLDIWRREGNYT